MKRKKVAKIDTRVLTPIDEPQLEENIVEKVASIGVEDLDRFGAWHALEELSSKTVFDGLEANPDGIFRVGKDSFEVVGIVYVTLEYGGKRDASVMSDSYPAKVTGKIGKNKIEIDSISVDVSSFYK
jgi:hypothetical protein